MEKGVVKVGNKVGKPVKQVVSKIPKPVRDVLQQEAQGLIDTTGSTLGMMIGQATGDEELGQMVKQGISDTGDELLSGQKLSLGSKILLIAKRSVNVVVDQIEDPRYKAVAKQIVKKSGAGLYGKAGQGLSGQGLSGSGLSGQGLSGSGMERSAVIRPAVMPRKPRFEKGSPEAKAYMASIRNNKQGSGFFKKIGRDIKKGAKKGKTALFGKRIGDEANVVLPIAGGVMGAVGGGYFGGPAGSALGSSVGTAGGKKLADDINKRGYGMKGGKGRRNPIIRPASDVPTFSPYASLYSPQNHPFKPQSSFQNGGSGERIM